MSAPDDNPKTRFGVQKPSMSNVPPVALLALMAAMKDGRGKYGQMNWRDDKVSSEIYYDAAMRHLLAWLDGEDFAPDSGVHHLGHVMACCAIILDATSLAMLNDNRPKKGMFGAMLEGISKKNSAATIGEVKPIEQRDAEKLASLDKKIYEDVVTEVTQIVREKEHIEGMCLSHKMRKEKLCNLTERLSLVDANLKTILDVLPGRDNENIHNWRDQVNKLKTTVENEILDASRLENEQAGVETVEAFQGLDKKFPWPHGSKTA
jgi:hypothetical protein